MGTKKNLRWQGRPRMTRTRAELVLHCCADQQPRSVPSSVLLIPGNHTTVHLCSCLAESDPKSWGIHPALRYHSNLLLSLQLDPGFPDPSRTTASPLRGLFSLAPSRLHPSSHTSCSQGIFLNCRNDHALCVLQIPQLLQVHAAFPAHVCTGFPGGLSPVCLH